MFEKVTKKAQKDAEKAAKAAAQAIEDAKSDAQKAYEAMQSEGTDAAVALGNDMQFRLLAMGYRFAPIIVPVNRGDLTTVKAAHIIMPVPFSDWERLSAEKKQKDDQSAAPEQKTDEATPQEQGEALEDASEVKE